VNNSINLLNGWRNGDIFLIHAEADI